MFQSDRLEMTAEVVAAFVSYNSVPKGELPALIQTVHAAMARLSGGVEIPPAVAAFETQPSTLRSPSSGDR